MVIYGFTLTTPIMRISLIKEYAFLFSLIVVIGGELVIEIAESEGRS